MYHTVREAPKFVVGVFFEPRDGLRIGDTIISTRRKLYAVFRCINVQVEKVAPAVLRLRRENSRVRARGRPRPVLRHVGGDQPSEQRLLRFAPTYPNFCQRYPSGRHRTLCRAMDHVEPKFETALALRKLVL